MSDQHPSGTDPERDATGWVILGIGLIVVGFFLGAHNLGIVPWQLSQAWGVIEKSRAGIGIVLLGALLIWWSQSGKGFTAPKRGTKLYRSRSDKWLAGVLGGFAHYFGFDATIVRLVFLALVILFDVGALVVAYIVMAIVVPQEPKGEPVAPAAPVWPTSTSAPAAPPAPVVQVPPVPEADAPVSPAAPTAEGPSESDAADTAE